LLGIKRLDKSEKIVFWWFLITFFLDWASTAYFASNGWANAEANLFIVNQGWIIGGLLSVLANIIMLWFILLIIQHNRFKKAFQRFNAIVAASTFMFIRSFVVINNFLVGSKVASGDVLKPSFAALISLYSWLALAVTILFFFAIICFGIFQATHRTDYEGNKPKSI
jgi:hypothetical protein